MNPAKAASIVAILAVALAAYLGTRACRAERASARDKELTLSLQSELAAARQELAEARHRAEAADEDATRLLGAIEKVNITNVRPSGQHPTTAKIARRDVEQRFDRAKQLVPSGQFGAAMDEFLWCYDVGMVGPSYMGIRSSELLRQMSELGRAYPAMREALEQRRAQAEKTMRTDSQDLEAALEFANLSAALGQKQQILDAYAGFPADDPRRRLLADSGAFDFLLEQQRYAEAAAARSFGAMSRSMDLLQAALPDTLANAAARAGVRRGIVQSTTQNIEVLAGSGDLEHAGALTAKLLAYDSSPETLAVLLERLTRAGHPELAKPAR
jgi:hypothetical protein